MTSFPYTNPPGFSERRTRVSDVETSNDAVIGNPLLCCRSKIVSYNEARYHSFAASAFLSIGSAVAMVVP